MSSPTAVFATAASDLWALGGWALVVAAVGATVAVRPITGAPPGRRAALAGLTLLLLATAVLPAAARFGDGVTWAAVLRGHAGDPSAVLVVAALWRLGGRLAVSPRGQTRGPDPDAQADRRWLLGLVAVAGWALVLTQLTTDRIDLYRLGYTGMEVALGTAVLAIAAALRGHVRTATALAGALAAWGLRLPESTNLWDALADPWLTLAATGWWMAWAWRRVRRPRARVNG